MRIGPGILYIGNRLGKKGQLSLPALFFTKKRAPSRNIQTHAKQKFISCVFLPLFHIFWYLLGGGDRKHKTCILSVSIFHRFT